MNPAILPRADRHISAYQIRFVSEMSSGSHSLIQFTDPRPCWAVLESLPPEKLLASGNETNSADQLRVLILPNNASELPDWQRRTEQWMADTSLEKMTSRIELQVKSGRIFWKPGQAVVQASEEDLNELLIALADFSFYEAELRELESQVRADLASSPQDIRLTHAVNAADLKLQSHVNEMTSRTTSARLKFVRLEPQIENASRLSGLAKLIASQMMEKARISERMETLDNQLEVLQDLYESANDRLTEFRYFKEEAALERWVIFLLWLEVGLLLLELFLFQTPR